MDFFEKLGNTISSTSKEAMKKTREGLDVVKINSKIKTEKDKLQKQYMEIGELFYTKNVDANIKDKDLQELCNSAKQVIEEIATLNKELETVKGLMECPECKKAVPNDATFCNYCGHKFEKEELTSEEIKEEVKEEKTTKKVCSKCKTEYSDDDVFCANCGNKLK